MGQMAATAGGVAIGSVAGNMLSNALMGGGDKGSEQQAPPPQQPAAYGGQPDPYQGYSQAGPAGPSEPSGPCAWEVKQFLQCSQTQADLSLCEGFNEALRQCKQRTQQGGATAMF